MSGVAMFCEYKWHVGIGNAHCMLTEFFFLNIFNIVHKWYFNPFVAFVWNSLVNGILSMLTWHIIYEIKIIAHNCSLLAVKIDKDFPIFRIHQIPA